jgi:hypothetical protein
MGRFSIVISSEEKGSFGHDATLYPLLGEIQENILKLPWKSNLRLQEAKKTTIYWGVIRPFKGQPG